MRKKSDVFSHSQIFKSRAEKEIGRHVWSLRANRGKEYFSDDFKVYLWQEGIQREFTC